MLAEQKHILMSSILSCLLLGLFKLKLVLNEFGFVLLGAGFVSLQEMLTVEHLLGVFGQTFDDFLEIFN